MRATLAAVQVNIPKSRCTFVDLRQRLRVRRLADALARVRAAGVPFFGGTGGRAADHGLAGRSEVRRALRERGSQAEGDVLIPVGLDTEVYACKAR